MSVRSSDLPHDRAGPLRLVRRGVRMVLGLALLIGGMLGFLPLLGFWMVPLGISLLGQEVPAVRRFERRMIASLRAIATSMRVRLGR